MKEKQKKERDLSQILIEAKPKDNADDDDIQQPLSDIDHSKSPPKSARSNASFQFGKYLGPSKVKHEKT